jgi:hypothetical protein
MTTNRIPPLCLCGENPLSFTLDSLYSDYSGGSPVAQNGSNFPHSRHSIAQFAKRQIHHLLSPHLRHNGGCSRNSRRFLRIFAHKSCNLAAVPVFPAIHFGDNSATIDTY